MQGGEELNIDELASNLDAYKDQLNQVRNLLADDPGNSEYADMERELVEVIGLTKELLATAKQADHSRPGATDHTGTSLDPRSSDGSPNLMASNSISEPFEQLAVGTKVQAVWSEDGEWYDATIEAQTPNGYYVSYDGWGNKEEHYKEVIQGVQQQPQNTVNPN